MNPIVRILITAVLVVALVPVAISLFLGVDTSGWDPTWVTIWDLIPMLIIVIIVVLFIGMMILRSRGAFALSPVMLAPVDTAWIAAFMIASALVYVGIEWRRHVGNARHSQLPSVR